MVLLIVMVILYFNEQAYNHSISGKYRGEDSILISVNDAGLQAWVSFLEEFIDNEETCSLKQLKANYHNINKPIILSFSDTNSGLIEDKNEFQWSLTKKVEILLCLSKSLDCNGHQYLDSDSEENIDLQVVLGLNEKVVF